MIFTIVLVFQLFSGMFCEDWKIDFNETAVQEHSFEIRKCCQIGEVLDSWYKCSPVDGSNEMFIDELSMMIVDDNLTVEDHVTVIPQFQCPRSLIREYVAEYLHSDGFLDIVENVFLNKTSSLNTYYCLEITASQGEVEGIHAIFCDQDGPRMFDEEPTGFLTKCCPHGSVLDPYLDDCVQLPDGYNDRDWIPPRMIQSELSLRPTGQYFFNISNFQEICQESEVADIVPDYVLTNGQIVLEANGTYEHLDYTCADRVLISESEVSDVMVLVCTSAGNYTDKEIFHNVSCESVDLRAVYTLFGTISMCCLLATLIVYLKLPTLKNLHGKIVINNIISILATTFLFLIILNRNPSHQDSCDNLDRGCAFIGYLLYYSSIVMFSWMSCMCFDLSWKFIRIRLPSQGSEKKKLWLYTACCWGLPFLFMIFAAICQLSLPHNSNFNPNIGCGECFIHSDGSRLLIFFHLPIFILVLGNILGLIITVHSLYKARAGTKKASSTRRSNSIRKSTTDKTRRKSLIPGKALNEETIEQLVNLT